MLFLNAHVSRTGGLTMSHILRRNFGDKHLDIYSQEISKTFGQARVKPTIGMLTLSELEKILDNYKHIRVKSISSHWIPIPDGIELLKQRFGKVKTITFLRNPIEVIVSKFFHFRHRYLNSKILPEHMRYDYRNDLSLFLKHWEHVSKEYAVQDQCRNYTTYFFDNENQDSDKCLSRLKGHFWFVGITERFNEGLIILKQKFQDLNISFNICYEKKNKGPKKKKKEKQLITKPILENIKSKNSIDLNLYRDITAIYEKSVKDYPGSINKDLFIYQKKLAVWRLYQSFSLNSSN